MSVTHWIGTVLAGALVMLLGAMSADIERQWQVQVPQVAAPAWVAAVLAQSDEQPGEQTPGPVEPPEFPPGVFCQRHDASPTPAHPCHCRAMDNCSKPEEGQGQGPRENNQCLQWCHKEHCHCKSKCE